jgi:hypothetical protein
MMQMVYNPNLVVVIDVRGITGKGGAPKSIGWALLPVFEEGSKFVASGNYHLPLFAGAVPSDLLDRLMDTERTVRQIVDEAKLKPGRASVLVRLLDSQVRAEAMRELWLAAHA